VIRALVLAIALAPALAHADATADAQKHIDEATRLFGVGNAGDAVKQLEQAYALDPRPEILYAFGQAYVALGQCDKAKSFFERFAEAKPDDAALVRDVPCRDLPPPIVKTEPPPPPPPPRRISRSWSSDTLGLAIVGAGLVLGGIGSYGLVSSNSLRDDAASAPTYDEFLSDLDKAKSKRTLSLVLLGGGGAALLGGIVHLVLHTRTEVVVTPTTNGAAVSWSRRF
jgi:tetratricopeptide (TPR) repeat protein